MPLNPLPSGLSLPTSLEYHEEMSRRGASLEKFLSSVSLFLGGTDKLCLSVWYIPYPRMYSNNTDKPCPPSRRTGTWFVRATLFSLIVILKFISLTFR